MSSSRARTAGYGALLAAAILLAHGGSLGDGLFFDDYWHRVTLSTTGWSFHDLVEAATFDLPGGLANLWWQDRPLQWRYARPVAMFFMKIEYVLARGSPVGIHAAALAWHWLTTLLVFGVARRALAFGRSDDDSAESAAARDRWALLAALLFAIHPQSVFAVSWTAARNALAGGFFFVAAIYAYCRLPDAASSASGMRRWGGAVLVALLWIVALFCRETAVILPLVVPFIDLARGGLRLARRRIGLYACLAAILCGYLYWRLIVFPAQGPPGIYFTVPSGVLGALWAATKLLHMLFAQFIHTPMFLGLSTYEGVSAGQAAEYAFVAVVVALLGAVYYAAARREPTAWLWAAWIVLAFVPVIPVFVMPHFSYLAAPASAMGVMLVVRAIRGRWRGVAVVAIVAYFAWPLAIYRYAWRGISRCEQTVYADMLENSPRPPAGAKLFYVNLPVAGIYATVALREAWSEPSLDGHVLTFAPHPLAMSGPFTLEKTAENELSLSCPPPGYFAGMSGRMLIDGMRGGESLRTGDVFRGEEFDAYIVDGDTSGVRAIRFVFRRSLDDPAYRFYVSTADRPAVALHLAGPQSAAAIRAQLEAPAALSPRLSAWIHEREWYFCIIDVARRFVRSNLYLTGE